MLSGRQDAGQARKEGVKFAAWQASPEEGLDREGNERDKPPCHTAPVSAIPQEALIFTASLALSIVSSVVLARQIDRFSTRLGLPEAGIGLLTALGADAPEISAAITALLHGNHAIGVGVVLGSNMFNLVALLGLGAVLGGSVRAGRSAVVLVGGATILVTLAGSLLALGLLSPPDAATLSALVFASAAALSLGRSPSLPKGRLARALARARAEEHHDLAPSATPAPGMTTLDIAMPLIPTLTAVVLASVGMVDTATALGQQMGVSPVVIGVVALAALTSLPNVLAAVRLVGQGRGGAVMNVTLNSNTINVLVGLCLPALFFAPPADAPSASSVLTIWTVGAATVATVAVAARSRGLSRAAGGALVLSYVVFVALVVTG